jgi:hypothetical protein
VECPEYIHSGAATEIDIDNVNPMECKNDKVTMAWLSCLAISAAGVPKLESQTESLE